MTIMLFRPKHLEAIESAAPVLALLRDSEEIEFDEDGRRYVFRYPPFVRKDYRIDRDRIFHYVRTHELPGIQARRILRDRRNAANFYEDVRDIQTHSDVIPA